MYFCLKDGEIDPECVACVQNNTNNTRTECEYF